MAGTVFGMPVGWEAGLTLPQWLRGAGVNLLLVVAAGVLAALCFGPWEWWPLAPVALAPLLLALRRTRGPRAAGWLTLLFGLVFAATALPWLLRIFGNVALGIYLLIALPTVLFGLGYRLLLSWKRRLLAALFTPVLWVGVDWLRCEGWYFQFSWLQLGFTLAPCPRAGALYSVVGVYGVTFLLVLCSAAVVELLQTRRGWPWLAAVLLPVALLGVVLAQPQTPPTGTVPVTLVQQENGGFDALRDATLACKANAPALVVWPEYALPLYLPEQQALQADVARLAQTMRATLIVGSEQRLPAGTDCDWLRRRAMQGELYANCAFVYSPDGILRGTYTKRHPIQFFADGVPGETSPTFDSPAGRVGVAICYDFDYALTPIRLVRNGAMLLAVPTFDAEGWTTVQHHQHGRMAQARAAEVGRWVARATSSGYSQVIAPDGQVTADLPDLAPGSLTARVSPRNDLTPYLRGGWLLPYACLLLSGLWAAGRARRAWRDWRRRRREANTAQAVAAQLSQ